ncbi:ABC transporter substrate-binding protein [Megalodesulfovibrio gigas]|uniref:ABC transporter substrate-binding protein n=1 Tax=Megalodesulfovibrio gigas TaxID=879 RepID=UPI0004036600|nr:ABC transporter substrate-binding protein [Megalodesulfovibrio gigas]
MRVRALSILLLLLSLFSLPAHAAEPIKVGLVVSASGPAAFLGEPEKNTAVMLVDAINAKGGVLGRPIELVIYDDETDVNKCVLAVDKLLKKDKVVAVVGPTTSGNTLAVMPKFEPAKVPLISMSAAEKITSPVNPWVFKVAPSDRHAVERILQDAQAKGMKKIAIITVSDGFGQAGREVLLQLLPQKGFELVADEVFGPKDTDMTAQLTAIKDKAPDAIICWGTNPGPAVVARNRQQLGIAIPLYMSHGVASKKFIELAGDAAEGLLLPAGRLIVAEQIAADHPQKDVVVRYAKDYEAAFKSPVSTFGGHAWDALGLIVAAIETGKSADPQSIRDNIEKIKDFVGTAGVFSFTAQDHNGLSLDAFTMVQIENGAWKLMK